ncbi:hypothetical protein ACJX0J_038390, partial [Zea mays]
LCYMFFLGTTTFGRVQFSHFIVDLPFQLLIQSVKGYEELKKKQHKIHPIAQIFFAFLELKKKLQTVLIIIVYVNLYFILFYIYFEIYYHMIFLFIFILF